MSVIGPTPLGAAHLAGSAAGSPRGEPRAGEAQAEAAQQKRQVDRLTLTAQALDDVTQSDESSDREPDGRRPEDDAPVVAADGVQETARERRRVPDPDGDTGGSLDLEV